LLAAQQQPEPTVVPKAFGMRRASMPNTGAVVGGVGVSGGSTWGNVRKIVKAVHAFHALGNAHHLKTFRFHDLCALRLSTPATVAPCRAIGRFGQLL
jgi:hypothetical protein